MVKETSMVPFVSQKCQNFESIHSSFLLVCLFYPLPLIKYNYVEHFKVSLTSILILTLAKCQREAKQLHDCFSFSIYL